jgi:hypothetical protein
VSELLNKAGHGIGPRLAAINIKQFLRLRVIYFPDDVARIDDCK